MQRKELHLDKDEIKQSNDDDDEYLIDPEKSLPQLSVREDLELVWSLSRSLPLSLPSRSHGRSAMGPLWAGSPVVREVGAGGQAGREAQGRGVDLCCCGSGVRCQRREAGLVTN